MIHNCWQFGHDFVIREEQLRTYSVCRICGKIGDIKNNIIMKKPIRLQDTSSTKNEVNSQEQFTETDKGLSNRSPLKLRNGEKGKELSVEKYSHELSHHPDIHSQNKELLDKDYVKTNEEVRE